MFYSKGRLASSDRVGLAILLVTRFFSRQRLRKGDMFVCRPDGTRCPSVEGVTCRWLMGRISQWPLLPS